MLNYEFISVEKQQYHAPRGGLLLLSGEQNPPPSVKPDSLLIGMFYKPHILKEYKAPWANLYHDIDIIAEREIGRHLFRGFLSSRSDKPVAGGFRTTYSLAGYGYTPIRNEKMYLTLGLGVAAGDFGIEFSNGSILPVFPVPIIKFGYNSRFINIAYDAPDFSMTIAPESRIRMTVFFPIEYSYSSVYDLLGEGILWYRLFTKDSAAGDFAGIGVGVKAENLKDYGRTFILAETYKTYDMNHYAVFGILDVSFLKISGGYIFHSLERFDKDNVQTGPGFFVSLQGTYRF
jgi:hypothetical protein